MFEAIDIFLSFHVVNKGVLSLNGSSWKAGYPVTEFADAAEVFLR
jgi:hypothetical protein